MTGSDVLQRIREAGYGGDIIECELLDSSVTGRCTTALIHKLKCDERFAQGIFHKLHPEVGQPRTEFRAHRDELGSGSLQIVINKRTGAFYADVDRHPTYSDVAGTVGHLFGEVLWPKLQRLFNRKRSA